MYQHAKTWGVRPSSLVAIDQEYRAFCFDESVAHWGNYVTNELDKVTGKTDAEVNRKRHSRLLELMQVPAERRFRSFKKRKK